MEAAAVASAKSAEVALGQERNGPLTLRNEGALGREVTFGLSLQEPGAKVTP